MMENAPFESARDNILITEMWAALERIEQKLGLIRHRSIIQPRKYTPHHRGEFIYFVLDPFFLVIKIGYTTHLERRFNELRLQWTSDLQFLGAINGNRDKEAELHKIFANLKCYSKLHREWFFAEKPLYDFIDKICEIRELANQGKEQTPCPE